MRLTILLLAMTITGCSNIERVYGDPIELAKKDCAKIGYYGQAYVQCVDRTVQQIRAQRSAERAAANSAPVINQQPQWQQEIQQLQQQQRYNSNRGMTCTPRLGGRIDCAPN
jgi:hypothetical protein